MLVPYDPLCPLKQQELQHIYCYIAEINISRELSVGGNLYSNKLIINIIQQKSAIKDMFIFISSYHGLTQF